MIKFYFLLMIIIANPALSQESDEAVKLFDKGNVLLDLYFYDLEIEQELKEVDTTIPENQKTYQYLLQLKEDILNKSLGYFEEVIENFPDSDLKFRAINNAAYIENLLGYNEEAISYYKMILESEADDLEPGGIGEGIMAEPYAMYKNRACKSLAEIYIQEKNFVYALKYLNLTKKYPYRHFCGNEYAADDIYMSTLYTKCYIGLNDIDKALAESLPQIYNNRLAGNFELVSLVINILKDNFDFEAVKNEYLNSIAAENIKYKKKNGYNLYYVNFLNYTIPYNDYNFSFDSSSKIDLKIIEEE